MGIFPNVPALRASCDETAEYITSLSIALILAACAHHQTVEVSEYHITNTAEKCAGKTACSGVYETGNACVDQRQGDDGT